MDWYLCPIVYVSLSWILRVKERPTTRHSTVRGVFRILHVRPENYPKWCITPVTRGKKPEAAIAEAGAFAERMGYRWMDNPHKDLPYDLQIFKPASFRLVKVRQTRYHIDPNGFYDQQFPDEISGLRSLPLPPFILRELWLRTRHERVWRRLLVHDLAVSEIEWWGPDDYINPHAR